MLLISPCFLLSNFNPYYLFFLGIKFNNVIFQIIYKMNGEEVMKKIVIPIILVVLIVAGLYVVYLVDESPTFISANSASLTVSSEGPVELGKII